MLELEVDGVMVERVGGGARHHLLFLFSGRGTGSFESGGWRMVESVGVIMLFFG